VRVYRLRQARYAPKGLPDGASVTPGVHQDSALLAGRAVAFNNVGTVTDAGEPSGNDHYRLSSHATAPGGWAEPMATTCQRKA
jgi:hypothetical protein